MTSLPWWERRTCVDGSSLGKMSKVCVIFDKRAGQGPDSSLILSTVRRGSTPAVMPQTRAERSPGRLLWLRTAAAPSAPLGRKENVWELNLRAFRINWKVGTELQDRKGPWKWGDSLLAM